VIIAMILSSPTMAVFSALGFVSALAYLGLYFLYLEHLRMFKVLFTILLIFLLLFPLAFVSQVNEVIRLVSLFSIMFYGVAIALYGGIKTILSFPHILGTAMKKSMEGKGK
jgi:hypothetical protein